MEEKKEFVDETDYKMLWEYVSKKRTEAEEENTALKDKLEDISRELSDANRAMHDAEYKIDCLNNTTSRLQGEVNAYRYCVRYYMAGGDER